MWPLALKTLLADRPKLLTAVVGVVFSILLVNVQGGLFLGLIRKASLLVDQGKADIWVGHKQMCNVDFPGDIPRRWGQRLSGIPGIACAKPYLVGHSIMTLPDGGFEQVLIVGCDPAALLGAAAQIVSGDPHAVLQTHGILVDVCDLDKIGNPQIGDVREIGQRRARIVGYTNGILGFLVTPYIFTTVERAAGFLHKADGNVSYFLVQVETGADPKDVCARIRERLPDAEACTRDEYAARSIDYWLTRTGLGISFGASTVLGLIVGLVIVGQTLYASVLDRLEEFATLKAIGANETQIYGIIVRQALTLAVVGAVLGLLLTNLVQAMFSTPRSPIAIPTHLSLGSVALVTGICLISSLVPYFRIRKIDPAVVLQG